MKHELTAQRLREALHDKGMSAQELANKTGIHKSSISQYYNGSNTMGNVKAFEIAKVLDVNPMWLMEFDVPKQRNDMVYVPIKNTSAINAIKDFEDNACKMYAKYLSADKKTRRTIDMLLESDED